MNVAATRWWFYKISKSWCSKQCTTHTNICTKVKQKDTFSDYYEATKEEDIKNTLKLSFNLFEILIK